MKRILNTLGKKSLHVKIILPALLAFALFVTSIFMIIIPRFEDIITGRKRDMIRELTNSAWSILDDYHNKEMNKSLTIAEAQKEATEQIRNLRYGDERKDYFWITDFKPAMIMHPYRKELDGTDLNDFKDPKNKKLFVEIVNVVKANEEGFVDYMWQWKDDSTRIVPKLSYVKEFKPWGWIIGTGIYIEDVKEEIARLEKNVFTISIIIALAVSFLLTFLTIQNLRTEKKRKEAENELRESKEKYQALVEASTEGLIMVIKGKQIFYNKTLLYMLGYNSDELPQLTLDNIFEWDKLRPQLQDEQNYIQMEAKARKKDGSLLDIHLQKTPISIPDNEGYVLIVKDISRHKEIVEELDASREKYISLTNQLTIGVFRAAANKEGTFIEANPTAVKVLGASGNEELMNYSLLDFFDNPKEGQLFIQQLYNESVIKNRVVSLRKLSGEKAIVSLSVVVINYDDKSPRFLDGIIEDITANKRTDEEKENLISELQASLLFLNKPARLFLTEPPHINMNATIEDTIAKMTLKKSDSILISTDKNVYMGIVTESDIHRRILAKKKSLAQPVFEAMSSPLITIEWNTSVYEALLILQNKGINHLAVKNEMDNIIGIVRTKELIRSSHLEYLVLVQGIKNSNSVEEIAGYYSKLTLLIRNLIESGAGIKTITGMTSMVADNVVRALVELYIKENDVPKAKFAFIVMGSGGREESTLVTDQDNAIIYEDVPENDEAVTNQSFLRMGEFVCNSLNKIGYSFCKGNIMAKNPAWCKPVSQWKKYFSDWVNTANPQNLLDVNIFFDFRSVWGEEQLTDELKKHINKITSVNNSFFVYLSQNAINITPPENQFKSGKPFDIKLMLLPIVDLLRVYSLKYQFRFNNTIDRLNFLYERNIISPVRYKEIFNIYNFLLQLRFQHQSKMISENLPPDNIINPKLLSEFELSIIKRIFSEIENFKSSLNIDFKGTI